MVHIGSHGSCSFTIIGCVDYSIIQNSQTGWLVVSICFSIRCMIMTHSFAPFPVLCCIHSMSFSRWSQKNSARSWSGTTPFVTLAMSISWCSLWQAAQRKEACMSTLTMLTAVADRSLSLCVLTRRCWGEPRSCPVLVVSFLYGRIQGHNSMGWPEKLCTYKDHSD